MLGVAHPDILLRQISSAQLAEWLAYFNRKPFGSDHSDYLTAQLTSVVSNLAGDKSKPTDFLPFHRDRQQTPEEIKTTLRRQLYGSSKKP